MAPLLCHYDPRRPFRIDIDASDGTAAVMLSQLQDDQQCHTIAFFSKTMDQVELNYSIRDKKMLAIIRSFDQ